MKYMTSLCKDVFMVYMHQLVTMPVVTSYISYLW